MEGNNNTGNEHKPTIRPISLVERLKAAIDRLKTNKDIKKLMDDGHGVYIDSATGEVKIIDENEVDSEIENKKIT